MAVTALVQDKRVWLGGGALVGVLIAAVSWFMVISPELSSAASLRSQASDTDQQSAIALSTVSKLRNQAKDLGALTASLQSALEALPPTSGLPAFTRQLNAQAAASHVAITSIAIAAVSQTGAAPGAAATPATDPAATPATGAAASGAPASAAGGLFAIPVTVTSSGSLANELAFLKAIQTVGPRRALVTSTQLGPGSGSQVASIDASATVTAQLTVYSAPLSPAQTAQLNKLLRGDVSN